MDQFNRFFVCFFDVLGFESRFAAWGLAGMLEKYTQLIRIVDQRNEATERWFGPINFSEGAYWTSEPDVFISAKLYGAYASDSIVLFAHADFPENRYPLALNSTPEERQLKAQHAATGWMYQTVPCDNFLDLCNEVICHSIEIGLPVRGALSMGEAVLHLDRGIFLGQPLIDTARLEHTQLCIGASFAGPFMSQIIPKRYQLSFMRHFRQDVPQIFSGVTLDWPRQWRRTRQANLIDVVQRLDVDPRFGKYYKTTEEVVIASQAIAHLFESPEESDIRKVYPQFSSPLVQLLVRPFRVEATDES